MKRIQKYQYKFSRKQVLGLCASLLVIGLFLYFNWFVFAENGVNSGLNPLPGAENNGQVADQGGFPEWLAAIWDFMKSALFRVKEILARV